MLVTSQSQALAFLLSSAIWRMFSRTPATFGLSKIAFSRTPNDTGHLDLASFASLSKSETNCAQPRKASLFLLSVRLRGIRFFCTRAHLRNPALHFFQNFLKFPLDFQKFFPIFELKVKVRFHTAPNWRELSLGGTFASFCLYNRAACRPF